MSKENQNNAVNLVCEGTTIVGDIQTKSDIRIDGIIKGNIFSTSRLVIGNTAQIEGNIDCVHIDVLGVVVGDVKASGTVTLKSSAKMTGNISTAVISIEPGVMFDGHCQMLKQGKKE